MIHETMSYLLPEKAGAVDLTQHQTTQLVRKTAASLLLGVLGFIQPAYAVGPLLDDQWEFSSEGQDFKEINEANSPTPSIAKMSQPSDVQVRNNEHGVVINTNRIGNPITEFFARALNEGMEPQPQLREFHFLSMNVAEMKAMVGPFQENYQNVIVTTVGQRQSKVAEQLQSWSSGFFGITHAVPLDGQLEGNSNAADVSMATAAYTSGDPFITFEFVVRNLQDTPITISRGFEHAFDIPMPVSADLQGDIILDVEILDTGGNPGASADFRSSLFLQSTSDIANPTTFNVEATEASFNQRLGIEDQTPVRIETGMFEIEGSLHTDTNQLSHFFAGVDVSNLTPGDTAIVRGIYSIGLLDDLNAETIDDQLNAFIPASLLEVPYLLTSVDVSPVFGDCSDDGILSSADLVCITTTEQRDTVLNALNTLPGDFDGDGEVAFSDFLTLARNFGELTATYAEGNVDLVGGVTFLDFLELAANFGKSPEQAAAVPEPCGRSLIWVCGLSLVWFHRKMRRG